METVKLEKVQFKSIDLSDPFFDSLKSDYLEFPNWFKKNQKNLLIYLEMIVVLLMDSCI